MKARTTLYDLLGLSPQASEADIHAAHIRLFNHYKSGTHGLQPMDAENQIKVIKEAYWILSDQGRRDAYDASLAAPIPPVGDLPPASGSAPLKVEIADVKWTPGRIMLSIIGGLMIIGMSIQIFFSVFAFKQAGRVASGEAAAEAQERVMAAEKRQMYGTLDDKEIAAQEAREAEERAESRRRAEEQRLEYARKEEERKREWALREREQYADRVSSDLERAEQSARQKAEWEKRQKEEAARRADMEEERRIQERVARERMRWQQELQR
ncbi:J domain-containing protein [Zoogloea dura]|uniref:DnaJ domain-containing protein n=1 Tax=Zoogloea dura TaxID=2728840 RepID=A0A848G2S6_9RHOO|nr:DnaJ domain-containing protein [Zoogloea dura]NML25305.1 DnaJ domain-containing protein [Zoogloea dura]